MQYVYIFAYHDSKMTFDDKQFGKVLLYAVYMMPLFSFNAS